MFILKSTKAAMAAAVVSLLAVAPAFAQVTIDTTEAESTIGAGLTAVAAIGGAILAVAAMVSVYRWVRRST